MSSLREQALTYLSVERDPAYIKTITDALSDDSELTKYFGTRPSFGTAGIRACLGPGYANLNGGVVLQTAQGYCAYLLATLGPDQLQSRGVVIGWDARHGSRDFAEITASTFVQRGVKVYLFGSIVPTPYVSFAIVHLGAAGGVMVTASHNPATYNGYKVYWGNGAQIIEPHDKGIAASIQQNLQPWPGFRISAWAESPLCTDPGEPVRLAYESLAFEKRCFHFADNGKPSPLLITYSAMHGVGHRATLSLFRRFGLPSFIPVPYQIEGNADFPTSAFPNPEEGEPVFRHSIRVADAHESTLIICQDPDADRVGLAVKKGDAWVILHGNHTGALLTWWIMRHFTGDRARALFEASTVSTRLQAVMAAREGFAHRETLTGFKWLGNVALDFQAAGGEPLFAFEEAIGFAVVPGNLPDKDAVMASAVVAEMAHWLAREEHKDLLDKLDDIYAQYGYFLFNNAFFMCHDPVVVKAVFTRMRTGGSGGAYIERIGEFAIARIRDMTNGYDSGTADHKTELPQQSGQMITFYLENGCIATIRTSGTEPKIKWYIEIGAEDKAKATADLAEVVRAVEDDLLQREKYGLKYTDD